MNHLVYTVGTLMAAFAFAMAILEIGL